MPEGISVIVDDEGYANITFENPLLRGPALDKLIKIGGAETVDKNTEHGYPTYRVPEGNARAAGLLSSRPVGKARVGVTVESSDLTSGLASTLEELNGPVLQPTHLAGAAPSAVDVASELQGLVAGAVHVAADGTETPLVPDADGLVTLVSGGTDAGTVPVEPQGNGDEPPAGTPLTEEENAALAAQNSAPETTPTPTPSVPEAKYPEGEPTTEWKLPQLKAYAADKGKDAQELNTKVKVLELINSK